MLTEPWPIADPIICLDGTVEVGTQLRLSGSTDRVLVLQVADDGCTARRARLSVRHLHALIVQLQAGLALIEQPESPRHTHQCSCICPTGGDCTKPVECQPVDKPGCSWPVCPRFPHQCEDCAAGRHATLFNIAPPSTGVR